MFYKAAVVVPFYTMLLFGLPYFFIPGMGELFLKIIFYSGITGLLSATLFFNILKRVAYSLWYSLLSFFLLPCSFMAYIIYSQVDWYLISQSKNVAFSCVLFVIFFIHLIGLVISFQDFRKSIIKTKQWQYEEQQVVIFKD